MRPPPLPQQINVLEDVLERAAEASAAGEAPVIVFDLDGTLFDSRARTQIILLEYAAEIESDYPEVAAQLRPIEVENIQYLLSTTLRDCGLTHPDVVRDITHFWRERYYSDEYLQYDLPAEGAAEYVDACYESGATILYLSGRDIPGMLLGTVSTLRDHGFPLAKPGVELVLKADATLPDEAFKRAVIPTLNRVGEVIAFFDNEPANCNAALAAFPDAWVTLLETQKVPGAPDPDVGVHHTTDFRIQ